MRSRLVYTLVIGFALSALSLQAIEAKKVKTATDKAGNWLVEQYDVKGREFKGEGGKDVVTVAMIVTALCDSPRDYKESNGPFVSEPVKFLLANIKADGSVNSSAKDACYWVLRALASTKNEKHAAVIEKLFMECPANEKSKETFTKIEQLTSPETSRPWLEQTLARADALSKSKTREITLDGKPVKWGDVLAENLMKLQQSNGSFGNDLAVNALAYEVLNLCYKAIK